MVVEVVEVVRVVELSVEWDYSSVAKVKEEAVAWWGMYTQRLTRNPRE